MALNGTGGLLMAKQPQGLSDFYQKDPMEASRCEGKPS